MIHSRIIPFLDVQSLAPGRAIEVLFRLHAASRG